ncbi:MAG: biofilm-associated protein, partial [Nitrosopumilus sp.]
MIRSSTRGILLTIVVLFSVSLILIPSNGYAEEINVKSVELDKTTIISFTNDAVEDVKTFRIWLGENVNFKSFKTEKGWIGEKNPQGVIIFTSSEPIKTGESV